MDRLKHLILVLSVVRIQQGDIPPEHITPSQVGKHLPECTKTRRPASVCEVSRNTGGVVAQSIQNAHPSETNSLPVFVLTSPCTIHEVDIHRCGLVSFVRLSSLPGDAAG